MTVAYWIVAALLTVVYLYAGALKLVRTREQLRPMMEWVENTPMWAVRAIGAVELLGAAGLILPPATGIAPALAIAAAAGFVVLQILATGVHIARGDKMIVLNVVMLVLGGAAGWLAVSRW